MVPYFLVIVKCTRKIVTFFNFYFRSLCQSLLKHVLLITDYLILNEKLAHFTANLEKAKETEEKTKQQYAESQHREKVLVRRLAAKEQEIQDYVVSKHPQNIKLIV